MDDPTPNYLPGGTALQVGDRVRYVGRPRRFHLRQQECRAGDTGTIVHDFGFDYRFLIKMDRLFWGGDIVQRVSNFRTTGIPSEVTATIRSGPFGWEKV